MLLWYLFRNAPSYDNYRDRNHFNIMPGTGNIIFNRVGGLGWEGVAQITSQMSKGLWKTRNAKSPTDSKVAW